jgi:hypothetical protein
MASEDPESQPREVKNHLLFEIATEVAHRGMVSRFRDDQLRWEKG